MRDNSLVKLLDRVWFVSGSGCSQDYCGVSCLHRSAAGVLPCGDNIGRFQFQNAIFLRSIARDGKLQQTVAKF